jgi:hypothetical protein
MVVSPMDYFISCAKFISQVIDKKYESLFMPIVTRIQTAKFERTI